MSLGTAKMPVNTAARDQSPATRHITGKSKNASEHGTANDKGARSCVEGKGGGGGRGVRRLFKHCHSHSDGARASKLPGDWRRCPCRDYVISDSGTRCDQRLAHKVRRSPAAPHSAVCRHLPRHAQAPALPHGGWLTLQQTGTLRH